MRTYHRTGRHTGVSVGLFGTILIGVGYLIYAMIAVRVIAAMIIVKLAMMAFGSRRRRLPPPPTRPAPPVAPPPPPPTLDFPASSAPPDGGVVTFTTADGREVRSIVVNRRSIHPNVVTFDWLPVPEKPQVSDSPCAPESDAVDPGTGRSDPISR